MNKPSTILTKFKIATDLFTLTLILILTEREFMHIEDFFSRQNIFLLGISLTAWMIASNILHLYEDYRLKPISIEWVVFLKTLVLYLLLFSFLVFQLLTEKQLTRGQLLIHASMMFFLMPMEKLFIRLLHKRVKNSEKMLRRVLIVGTGKTGQNFYQDYIQTKSFGYRLTGFIGDEIRQTKKGLYLGKTSELEEVIATHELDDIIVTLPMTSEAQIGNIITVGERHGKRVRIIPDYQHFGVEKMHVDKLGSLSIITLRSSPLDFSDNKIYKRVFDIGFSLLVILLVFPVMLPLVALLIKFTSKGPVFFKQKRWGLNNKTVTCYKFRSMTIASKDVDENGRYVQASRNDARLTPVGKFLRKSNIDELPQFFNVLFGSMSVVGPRPHPIPLNLESKETVDRYMMRHWVKPGITGWAQVNGYRGETRWPDLMKMRVEHDLWYMENWTLWLDLQIVMQTLVNIVKGEKNAF